MTARLVAGRIGGLPVYGGHIPLEQADMAQVLTAATGLLRETVNTGAKVAVAGLGIAGLLSFLSSMERAEEAKKLDRVQNPPRSFGGVCLVRQLSNSYYGVCLDPSISFRQAAYEPRMQTVATEHVVSIRYESGLFGGRLVIELIDGSIFSGICAERPLRFMTIAGMVEVNLKETYTLNIDGLSHLKTEAYKARLVDGLKQTRLELLNQIGVDLVQKYFHIEDAEIIEVAEPVQPPNPSAVSTDGTSMGGKLVLALALSMFMVTGALGGALLYFFV
jgi:hypothetical protein